jgi:ATP-dependent helicase/nuclease subunit B
MSLQLVLGGSGSGKSFHLYNRVIKDSIENPQDNYLVIVPEQYTMETQKKLVSMHPRRGIMNIDIVSFQRLAFRVFSEIGGGNEQVLDDTGKNLIVRKVLESNKKELKIFGNNMNKIGFVSEMKSVISELLQYAVTPQQVLEIGGKLTENPLLSEKMQDIQLIIHLLKNILKKNILRPKKFSMFFVM